MAKVKIVKMPTLQKALDKESYEWLASNAPDILEALEVEVGRGSKPDDIHLFVRGEYERPELAQRLRQAARHIGAGNG